MSGGTQDPESPSLSLEDRLAKRLNTQALSSTGAVAVPGYAVDTRCPVLTYAMPLPASEYQHTSRSAPLCAYACALRLWWYGIYGMSGTEIGYGAMQYERTEIGYDAMQSGRTELGHGAVQSHRTELGYGTSRSTELGMVLYSDRTERGYGTSRSTELGMVLYNLIVLSEGMVPATELSLIHISEPTRPRLI
eukprot:2931781-Rhodomonas_salina.1